MGVGALGLVVFGVAYTQAPLYVANQNTYFLHGLARCGWGVLSSDWLAGTADPFPLFSAIVEITCRYLPEGAYYGYALALLGVYLFSLREIVLHHYGERRFSVFDQVYVLSFVLLHSGAFGLISREALGIKVGWLLQAGLAGQYLLGPVFQPSMFGVFLLLSIALYLRGRSALAASASGLAAAIHPSYLLSAGVLNLSYVALGGFGRKAFRKWWWPGLLSIAFLSPSIVFLVQRFGPTSLEAFRQAQAILADVRIPHHARPSVWFDGTSAFQIVVLVSGLYLLQRGKLLRVAIALAAAGAGVTLLQLITGSRSLALAFPWRVSVVLIPLSTSILLAILTSRAIRAFNRVLERRQTVVRWGLVLIASILFLSGVFLMHKGFIQGNVTFLDEREVPMMAYVKSVRTPDQRYLIPIHLERFRLFTGVPIFVDWKSHPYRDVEVIEWYARIQAAERFYAETVDGRRCEMLNDLKRHDAVDHVVLPGDQKLSCRGAELLYRDREFAVYQLG